MMHSARVQKAHDILLADDDPAVLHATSALLRHAGYRVECVSTGSKAAERMSARRYDLVILDIHMPGNHELEVVRGHAGTETKLGTPIMIITGEPTTASAIEALRHSVLDYLTKPFEPGQLVERVRVAIDRAHATRTLSVVQTHLSTLQELVDTLEPPKRKRRSRARGRTRTARALTAAERALLSARELEVLTAVANGTANNDIANQLALSPNTVRNHVKAICKKLGMESRHQLLTKLLRE